MDSRGLGATATSSRHTEHRGTDADSRAVTYAGATQAGLPAAKRPELTINFEKDKHDLLGIEQQKLDVVAATLDQQAYSVARLVGHASTEGDPKYNQLLSEKRVDAVVKYLVQTRKVRRHQLIESAVGATQPLVRENGDEARRAINRRVEITIERNAPGCLSAAQVKFIETTIDRKRKAVSILSGIRDKLEQQVDQLLQQQKNEPNFQGWSLADLRSEIVDVDSRITMHQRHRDDWENASRERACWDRFEQLEKQRQADIGSVARYEQRLEALQIQLAEALDKKKNTTGPENAFWNSAADTLKDLIVRYTDARNVAKEAQLPVGG